VQIQARMCYTFRCLPSQLDKELCPRIFIAWRQILEEDIDKERNIRRWHLAIAPLFRTSMSDEGAEEQIKYHRDLTDALMSEGERQDTREMRNKDAERRLAALGVNIRK